MTEKIRLEVEDATNLGLKSFEENLQDVKREADKLEKELNQVGKATDDLGDKKPDRNWNLTNLNQGLEILKKGFGLASRALEQLAADGNPAFLELQGAIKDVQNALLDVATDPEIQGMASNLAGTIKDSLLPAIRGIPDAWRSAQDAVADFTARAGEAIGVFAEGTTEALKEIQEEEKKQLEIAKEAAKLAEQRAAVDGKLGDLRKKLAEQQELMAMAQLTSERLILDLIDEETEKLRELAKEGRATAEERESGLKKIELLERRLSEVRKAAFDDEIKAQQEASQARFEAQQKVNEAEAKFAEEQKKRAAEEAQAVAQAEEMKRQEREKTRQAEEAALLKAGGADVSRARASLDPRAVREQVARQRQAEAAAAGGGEREIRDARRQAFNLFNRGGIGGEEIGRAQNELLNQQVGNAEKRGQVDSQNAQLLRQVINAEQNSAAQQEAFGQQLQQLQSAMSSVNKTQSGTRQRFQAAGMGR